MKRSFLAGAVLLLCWTSWVSAAETTEAADTDKDGKPDEWRISDGGKLVRIERDRDRDGKREIRIWMKDGKPERSEVDRNGDGVPDLVRFLKEGKPASLARNRGEARKLLQELGRFSRREHLAMPKL